MSYEIVGSRIVAPYLGASTYIWTSLIGVILGALSLGYWLGGKAADRRPDIRVLAGAIFAAGGAVTVTILAKDVILSMIASMPAPLEIKAVLASLLLFAPAAVALGFVIPYSTRLRIAAVSTAGSTVGRLYALSTIGSIAGTFLAGFLFIPYVGSSRTLYFIGGCLFLLSFLLVPFTLTRNRVSILALFCLAVVGNELIAYYSRAAFGLFDFDTEYSRIRIFETRNAGDGRPMRAMSTDPYSVQSAIFLDGEDLALEYTKFYHLVDAFNSGHRRSLMIGGAGFSFPQDYLRRYPGTTIDVVEIDPQVTSLARRFFRLEDDPRMRIFHEDGRVFLNNASGPYDAVFVDAFGSLLTIPFHLTTIETVRQIDRVLDPQGVVILNLGSAIKGPRDRFLKAELATYRAVFTNVAVFKVRPERPDDDTQNLIIVASRSNSLRPHTEAAGDHSALLKKRLDTTGIDSVTPLTDDLAPVESYLSFVR
jgi:spermidine synthase